LNIQILHLQQTKNFLKIFHLKKQGPKAIAFGPYGSF